jgi:hypothetical protein
VEAVTARWTPVWYNLDDGLAVGETNVWWFWNDHRSMQESPWGATLPDHPDCDLYFHTGGFSAHDAPHAHQRRATVAAITHDFLGSLTRVGTDEFGTYEFEAPDGTVFEVEAEEGPGRCWSHRVPFDDWSVLVLLDGVSEPFPDPLGAVQAILAEAERRNEIARAQRRSRWKSSSSRGRDPTRRHHHHDEAARRPPASPPQPAPGTDGRPAASGAGAIGGRASDTPPLVANGPVRSTSVAEPIEMPSASICCATSTPIHSPTG